MQTGGRLLAISSVGLVLMLSASSSRAATLDVMAFNIRNVTTFTNLAGPPNGWFDVNDLPSGNLVNGRRLRAIAVIQANDPDIMGVQEADQIQVDDLLGEFPHLDYFGAGRDDGLQLGEQSGIFYRADRFTRIDGGHFWLSTTPEVPGTTFATSFDSGNPRMATWVVLDDSLTGRSLFVLNTHWSLSSSARSSSADLIRDRLPALAGSLPVIVTGDLNTSESSSAFRTLRDGSDPSDRQLVDAYREVFLNPSSNERTFHNYNGGTSGSRIDHVLYSEGDFVALDAAIDRTSFEGLFPSDHYPVTATLLVPEPRSVGLLFLGITLVATVVRARSPVVARSNRSADARESQ